MDEMKEEFYAEVNRSFPDMGLCANNWKAETVATLRYSSWAQMHLKGLKDSHLTVGKHILKLEADSVELDAKRTKHSYDPSPSLAHNVNSLPVGLGISSTLPDTESALSSESSEPPLSNVSLDVVQVAPQVRVKCPL
jgi:hypothetical protein